MWQCVALCCVAVCCSVLQQCVAGCLCRQDSFHSHTHSLALSVSRTGWIQGRDKGALCVAACVAVYCSVLQRVAVCCSVLQCVAVCCSVLQCVAVCCSMLQCVAVCLTHTYNFSVSRTGWIQGRDKGALTNGFFCHVL